MHVIAVNGSPRKKWNTATLLEHALEGAASQGAKTRLAHLYDLDYTGCVSCFSCKRIGGGNYGRCAVKDGLTPLLEDIARADALILGSPVYFRTETGAMRSFMERLLFPYLTYTPELASLYPGTIRTALVYTMNVTEAGMVRNHQDTFIQSTRHYVDHTLGPCEVLLSTDTLQFDDYSRYLSTRFDAAAKRRRREEVFPLDCERARDLGAALARGAAGA